MSKRLEIKTSKPLKILVVPDTHFPYQDTKALAYVSDFAKSFKPTHIVHIGDLYDQYNFSKYSKSRNFDTPSQEIKKGRQLASSFWTELPECPKFQLLGNHCIRMRKRVLDKSPELEDAVDAFLDGLFRFPGVTTLPDDRAELVINDILFIHGYLGNPGDHAKVNQMNTVVGHSHRGGLVTIGRAGKTLWELNVGHVADESLVPFNYTPQRTTFWVKGFGTLETLQGGVVAPRFIPL